MKQIGDLQSEAIDEHKKRFSCSCESTVLRTREIRGGAKQYVYQCVRCGEVSSQPVAKVKALEICGGSEPPEIDTSLRENWRKSESEERANLNERTRNVFWSGYTEYLKSPEWGKRRLLVFERSNGVCEGCGMQPATQVHHHSYKHVGNEFLFELAAICDSCHERFHSEE